jgi:integrase
MARKANTVLDSKTARLKLKPRLQPYFTQVGPRVTLGYVRCDPPPGSWVRRENNPENGEDSYTRTTIGAADDVARADGKTILTFEQARDKAANDGATQADAEPLTVKRAVERYLAELASRSDHSKEAKQRADKHIIPKLGKLRVSKLTKGQIEQWRGGLVALDDPDDPDARRRSQDTANRILTLLKAALNHAFADDANGIPTDTAWRRVKAFKDVAASRPDHFDAVQVRQLIAKAAAFDKPFANLLEAGYLTGARLGELVALDVQDFDAGNAVLSVRKGKTGARPITLTAEAVRFFKRLTNKRPLRAALLPKADGDRWGKSHQAKPFKKAAKLAELPASTSFYTLRHSHISRAIEAHMPLTLVAENCGTSLTMIERNYGHVLARTRRDMVEATSPKLRRVK